MPHYKRNIRFVIIILLPILAFLLGWVLSQRSHSTGQINTGQLVPQETQADAEDPEIEIKKADREDKNPKDVDLSMLWETWDEMEKNFLYTDRFESKEQVYGLISGMVESLDDPYTTFLTPDQTQIFDESIDGEFEGIGAEIEVKNDILKIVTPLKGSPAEKSGILPGDIITEIGGESSFGLSIFEAVNKIKGPKGTPVTLTIARESEVLPIEIVIVRDSINVPNVEWKMVGENEDVAYVGVSQFGTKMANELEEAISQIVLEQPTGVVIDLRNNGGGLLDAAVRLAEQFLERKIVVKTRGRNFGSNAEIKTNGQGVFTTIPLVVMINRGSASASEIFAGAVQDHARGVVLGETSFGKGSVQNIIPLSDKSSLKVTIAEWLTPLGKTISEVGVTPDVEIEVTEEMLSSKDDSFLNTALELLQNEYQTKLDERISANKLYEAQKSESDLPETPE